MEAASIQKLCFQPYTKVCFAQFCSKSSKNTPIFGNCFGAATIQERPLLVRVRELVIIFQG